MSPVNFQKKLQNIDTCSQDSTFFQIHASEDLNPSSFKLREINKNKLHDKEFWG